MTDNAEARGSSAARRLAISGALITGTAGIIMAVYSVVSGEHAGGGALLAASALAYGLLALNLEWVPGRSASSRVLLQGAAPNGRGPEPVIAAAQNPQLIDADPMTDRELEVLALVAEGHSNKLISSALGISERTVKNHLTATMSKLRASDRTHAVVTAVRLGWLDITQGPVNSNGK